MRMLINVCVCAVCHPSVQSKQCECLYSHLCQLAPSIINDFHSFEWHKNGDTMLLK